MDPSNQDDTAGREALFEKILLSMHEGVMTADLKGRIVTFNPAASALLKLEADRVIGSSVAEVLFGDERNDPFTQLILDAIYDPSHSCSGEVEYFSHDGSVWLLVTTSTLTDTFGQGQGVIVVMYDISERKRAEHIRETFGRYIDPRIVASLIDRRDSEGERRVMTVSFTDMEGFTSLAEATTPGMLVKLLNGYLTEMSRPIMEQNGIVDKYIGDAIMAFWGPPFTGEEAHATAACFAALGQRKLLGELSRCCPTTPIEIRCGIATGELICGSIGSERQRNYTVLGDPVNLAARLESANKAYGTRILLSETTRRLAGSAIVVREVDRVRVVGKAQPVAIFELLATHEQELPDHRRRLIDLFEEALTAYRGRDLQRAGSLFAECLKVDPQDGPSRVFDSRVKRLVAAPPSEAWDGVWNLDAK